MARIRSVHPGLFTDETFVVLTHPARWFLIGLLTECDDQGVFEWNAIKLKMRLAPADNDVAAGDLLDELAAHNKVRRFEHGGRQYGAVRNFRKYQRPKKPNSIHPLPPELRDYVQVNARSSELDDGEPQPVPRKSELPQQMEEGGDGMEEIHPPTPQGGRKVVLNVEGTGRRNGRAERRNRPRSLRAALAADQEIGAEVDALVEADGDAGNSSTAEVISRRQGGDGEGLRQIAGIQIRGTTEGAGGVQGGGAIRRDEPVGRISDAQNAVRCAGDGTTAEVAAISRIVGVAGGEESSSKRGVLTAGADLPDLPEFLVRKA